MNIDMEHTENSRVNIQLSTQKSTIEFSFYIMTARIADLDNMQFRGFKNSNSSIYHIKCMKTRDRNWNGPGIGAKIKS